MKKQVKRYFALALTFALVFAIPFAFTQEASAASKKTKYVVTSETITYSSGTTYTTKYTYFKNGLLKSRTSTTGSQMIYTRNKKGDITSYKMKTSGGENIYASYKYEYNKKGLPVKQYEYSEYNKLVSTYNNSFYKSGKQKESVETLSDGNSTLTYKYNKKGDPTLIRYSSGGYVTQATYSYKYDKKGNPVKAVSVDDVIDGGATEKSTTTTTYKYKYDKKKNIKRADITEVTTYNDGKTRTSSRTITYKYKKVKVAKKLLRFFR